MALQAQGELLNNLFVLWKGAMSSKINISNAITSVRLVMVPIVGYLFATGAVVAGTTVGMLGIISDLLDGYVARRWNQVSSFGHRFDVHADRLLLAAPLWGMVIADDIPLGIAAVFSGGLWLGDYLARSTTGDLLRLGWWIAGYAVIAYGVAIHTAWGIFIPLAALFTLVTLAVLIIKHEEVRRLTRHVRRFSP